MRAAMPVGFFYRREFQVKLPLRAMQALGSIHTRFRGLIE